MSVQCPLSGVKQTSRRKVATSVSTLNRHKREYFVATYSALIVQ